MPKITADGTLLPTHNAPSPKAQSLVYYAFGLVFAGALFFGFPPVHAGFLGLFTAGVAHLYNNAPATETKQRRSCNGGSNVMGVGDLPKPARGG